MSGLVSSHGQNERTTKRKEDIIALTLGWLVRFASRTADAGPYWAFDLTAGSGSNRHANSTPEVILKAKPKRLHAYFIERNGTRCKQLRARLPSQAGLFGDDHRKWEIIHGDHRDFLPCIPSIIRSHGVLPGRAEGVIISDPNGSTQPLPELRAIAISCPRLDMIIRAGSAAPHRGYAKTHPGWPTDRSRHIFYLADLMSIEKRTWLVARLPSGRGGAVLFVGTNLRSIPGMAPLGLYRSDEPEGTRITRWFDEGGRWQD